MLQHSGHGRHPHPLLKVVAASIGTIAGVDVVLLGSGVDPAQCLPLASSAFCVSVPLSRRMMADENSVDRAFAVCLSSIPYLMANAGRNIPWAMFAVMLLGSVALAMSPISHRNR